jgi:biopolymer transport protein ExbB/TolQ
MLPPLPLANILVDTFSHGGVLMWPLLGLSLVTLAAIVERIFWWTAARLVGVQPGKQAVGAAPRGDPVIGRQRTGMARELLDAEQFGPQGRLDSARARPPVDPGVPS